MSLRIYVGNLWLAKCTKNEPILKSCAKSLKLFCYYVIDCSMYIRTYVLILSITGLTASRKQSRKITVVKGGTVAMALQINGHTCSIFATQQQCCAGTLNDNHE